MRYIDLENLFNVKSNIYISLNKFTTHTHTHTHTHTQNIDRVT